MRYQYAKNLYKKFSSLSVALVVALSSFAAITPLFLTKEASAAADPLTVATSCTNNGVLLTLTATNTLGKNALIWFSTDYGSSSEHGFLKDDTKIWTQQTNTPTVPPSTVSATAKYVVATPNFPYFEVASTTYTAHYDALSCLPEAPVITTPMTYLNNTKLSETLSWTHPNPATITSYEYREYTNISDANSDSNYTAQTISPATTSTTYTAGPVDKTVYWRVNAKNTYGFTSGLSAVGTITTDRTTPTAAINTDQDLYGGSRNHIIASGASSEPDVTYNFTIADGSGIKDSASSTSTSWDILNVNNPALYPSGAYTVSLSVTDAAGNTSPAAIKEVTIDNTAPEVSIAPITDPIIGKTVEPEVTVNETSEIKSYSWRADDPAYNALISDPTIKNPVFSPSETGTYTFYLTVTDILDNTTIDVPFTFEWKTILPAGNINTGSTDTIATPVANPAPASLVATIFNSTNPQVLGITTTDTGDNKDAGKTKSISTEKKKEKEIVAPASGNFAWYWILLIIAILVAIYYAYRNWRLGKVNK